MPHISRRDQRKSVLVLGWKPRPLRPGTSVSDKTSALALVARFYKRPGDTRTPAFVVCSGRSACPMLLLTMRKFTIFSLCVLVVLAGNASAQEKGIGPAGNGITAAAILEKNFAATGGREAHQRLQSMVVSGDLGYSYPNPSSFSFFYRAPSDDAIRMQVYRFGTFWRGRHAGQPFWRGALERHDLFTVNHPELMLSSTWKLVGEPQDMHVVEQDLRDLLEWDFTNYEKVELIGRAEVDQRWALALRFTPHKGDSVMRYYDSESFLLVRMDQVERLRPTKDGPETARLVKSYFSDYKESGGLKLPRVIRISRPQGESALKLSKIETNVKIDGSVFE